MSSTTQQPNKATIMHRMQKIYSEHIDIVTGEINLTTLAQETCDDFDAYEGDDIPEVFFEAAFEVFEAQSQTE